MTRQTPRAAAMATLCLFALALSASPASAASFLYNPPPFLPRSAY
jgi:hypothetical protein